MRSIVTMTISISLFLGAIFAIISSHESNMAAEAARRQRLIELQEGR